MKALLIVDVQNDFVEGGALPVTGGLEVARKIGELLNGPIEDEDWDCVLATKDHHIAPGPHFAKFSEKPDYKVSWPKHCVPNSWGWEFVPDAFPHAHPFDYLAGVFYKGMFGDGYSGATGVLDPSDPKALLQPGNAVTMLKKFDQLDISEVDIVGLALDHCVRATALDLAANPNIAKVRVLRDYTAAVDKSYDGADLKAAGVEIV